MKNVLNLQVVSDTEVTCNVPTTDVNAGTYDVHLSAQGGETTGQFSYIKPAEPPTITSIGSSSGKIGTSWLITAHGTNLETVRDAYVDLNKNDLRDDGESCSALRDVTDTQFSCVTPVTATVGIYDFCAITAGGTAQLNKSILYYSLEAIDTGHGPWVNLNPGSDNDYTIGGVHAMFAFTNRTGEPNDQTNYGYFMAESGEKVMYDSITDIYADSRNESFLCTSLPGGRVIVGKPVLRTKRDDSSSDIIMSYSYGVSCASNNTQSTDIIDNVMNNTDREYNKGSGHRLYFVVGQKLFSVF